MTHVDINSDTISWRGTARATQYAFLFLLDIFLFFRGRPIYVCSKLAVKMEPEEKRHYQYDEASGVITPRGPREAHMGAAQAHLPPSRYPQ